LVAREIIRVFYAPHKVFKEIFRQPKFIGPILILIVFIAVQTSAYYVQATKMYSEISLPTDQQADAWTEDAKLWQATPGVSISNNYVDFINGTASPDYYGNCSIEFEADGIKTLQIALASLGGSVDCGQTGFRNLTLRVKMIKPESMPQNATLILYSLDDTSYFSYDLTSEFSRAAPRSWNNITVPVGSTDWMSSSLDAKWQNITSLMIELRWSEESSVQLLVDGLFFRGVFKNGVEVQGTQRLLMSYAALATFSFLFQWLFLSAILFILIKLFKGSVSWNQLMVAVGFASVTMVVQAVVLLVTYSTLSPVNLPLEYFGGVPNEFNAANLILRETLKVESLITSASQIIVWIWAIILGAFIVREVPTASVGPGGEESSKVRLSWLKCLGLSAMAFALTILIMLILRL
jgi:hypothetical protein